MIGCLVDRVRLALDVLVHGPMTETAVPPLQPVGDPWGVPDLADTRQAAALSMLDPDVAGFVLVRFLRENCGVRCSVDVSHVVERDWWPAVRELLESAPSR